MPGLYCSPCTATTPTPAAMSAGGWLLVGAPLQTTTTTTSPGTLGALLPRRTVSLSFFPTMAVWPAKHVYRRWGAARRSPVQLPQGHGSCVSRREAVCIRLHNTGRSALVSVPSVRMMPSPALTAQRPRVYVHTHIRTYIDTRTQTDYRTGGTGLQGPRPCPVLQLHPSIGMSKATTRTQPWRLPHSRSPPASC